MPSDCAEATVGQCGAAEGDDGIVFECDKYVAVEQDWGAAFERYAGQPLLICPEHQHGFSTGEELVERGAANRLNVKSLAAKV